MPLTDDQRALLRLLAQREQGYGDIAALMGLSVEQVRERVGEALAALDETGAGPGPARMPVAPPPTPAAAPAVPEPERPQPRPHATPAAGRAPAVRRPPLPKTRRGLIELVGGAFVVLLLVLFMTGAVDIGGGGSSASKATRPPTEVASAEGKKLTQAVLEPVDGGSANGRALFGRSKENVMLLVEAKGLEPSPKGKSYAISLVRSQSERVPIAATEVGSSGTIAGQFQVSPESLGLLASGFDQMEVTLVANAALRTALTAAGKEGKAPVYSGTDVLRGPVTGPIVKK